MVSSFYGFDSIMNDANLAGYKPVRLYRGKDHNCRCGCRGHYYENGERGYKMALTMLKKFDIFHGVEIASSGKNEMYANIPYGEPSDDRCVTIYFSKQKRAA